MITGGKIEIIDMPYLTTTQSHSTNLKINTTNCVYFQKAQQYLTSCVYTAVSTHFKTTRQ